MRGDNESRNGKEKGSMKGKSRSKEIDLCWQTKNKYLGQKVKFLF